MDRDKQRSKHFIKYFVNGKKFDFNDFKTSEELKNYQEELKEYLKVTDSEKKDR